MEINFFKLKTVLILLVFILISSCDKFVNLGDSEKASYDDGFPEDLVENEKDGYDDTGGSEGPGNDYGDTGNTGDSGNSGNTGESYYDEDSGYEKADDEYYYNDSDNIPEWPKESPFPDDFTNDSCDCGASPAYNPVCCVNEKGLISVFNACFANCYFLFSEGKICSNYNTGICDSIPAYDTETEDAEDSIDDDVMPEFDNDICDCEYDDQDYYNDQDYNSDSDIEADDEDSHYKPDNECGCYPSDTEFLCCYKNSTVLISYCLANCHCNGAYLPCFK